MAGTYFEYHENRFPPGGSDADYLDRPFQPEKPPFDWHKVRQRMIGSLAVACAVVGGYNAMNAPEKRRIAEAEMSLTQVHEALHADDADAVTIVAGGLGQRNAKYAAKNLEQLAEYGDVWELEHDDKTISPAAATALIRQKLDAAGKTRVSFYGASMGGNELIEVASNLWEQAPHIITEVIYADSSPCTINSVRPEMRHRGDIGFSLIDQIPDAEYNWLVRYVGETIIRSPWFIREESIQTEQGAALTSQIFDFERFIFTSNTVWKYIITSPNSASTPLASAQFRYLLGADSRAALGRFEHGNVTRQRPVFVYIRAEDARQDGVVNVEEAEACFAEIADDYHLSFASIRVGGMEHTLVSSKLKPFKETLAQELPAITNLVTAARRATVRVPLFTAAEKATQNTLLQRPNVPYIDK